MSKPTREIAFFWEGGKQEKKRGGKIGAVWGGVTHEGADFGGEKTCAVGKKTRQSKKKAGASDAIADIK